MIKIIVILDCILIYVIFILPFSYRFFSFLKKKIDQKNSIKNDFKHEDFK